MDTRHHRPADGSSFDPILGAPWPAVEDATECEPTRPGLVALEHITPRTRAVFSCGWFSWVAAGWRSVCIAMDSKTLAHVPCAPRPQN
jgi:hypothetical protein